MVKAALGDAAQNDGSFDGKREGVAGSCSKPIDDLPKPLMIDWE